MFNIFGNSPSRSKDKIRNIIRNNWLLFNGNKNDVLYVFALHTPKIRKVIRSFYYSVGTPTRQLQTELQLHLCFSYIRSQT